MKEMMGGSRRGSEEVIVEAANLGDAWVKAKLIVLHSFRRFDGGSCSEIKENDISGN